MMRQRPWLQWLLLGGWMAVIYAASDTPDLRAVPVAQRLGLLPNALGAEAANLLEWILRKSAHAVTFGVLALLARRALASRPHPRKARQLDLGALAMAVAYAAADEWHQRYVPTRVGTASDVLIDAAGAFLALLLLHRIARRSPRLTTAGDGA